MTPALARLAAAALRRHADWLADALLSGAIVGVRARAEASDAVRAHHAMAAELEAAAACADPACPPDPPAVPKRDLAALFLLDRLPPHPPGASIT